MKTVHLNLQQLAQVCVTHTHAGARVAGEKCSLPLPDAPQAASHSATQLSMCPVIYQQGLCQRPDQLTPFPPCSFQTERLSSDTWQHHPATLSMHNQHLPVGSPERPEPFSLDDLWDEGRS